MSERPPELEDLEFLDKLGDTLHRSFQEAEQGKRRVRRPWQMPAIAIGLAVLIAAVIAVTSGLQNGHVAPSVAQALDAVADRALATGAPVPADDQFYFVASQSTDLVAPASTSNATVGTLVTKERRVWQSIARAGQIREHVLSSRPARPAGTSAPITTPTTPAQRQPATIAALSRYDLGGIRLTRQQLLDFPTDPQTIIARLAAQRGHPLTPTELFDVVADALRELPAPAGLRAGLFRALALVPGIESEPTTSDSLNRTGAAVTLTATGVKRELIYNPDTSEILAERATVIDHDAAQLDVPDGTLIRDTTYLQRAVSDQLPD